MQYWSNDEVFSKESFEDLFEAVKTEKNIICYDWVDHWFRKIWNIDSTIPYDIVLEKVSSLILWEELINTPISLSNDVLELMELINHDLFKKIKNTI
jgi:hypothetical protein